MKSTMERNFGLGMIDLFHPVTGEFNHAAVIERRGGRKPEEVLGTEKGLGIHQTMAWIHNLYGTHKGEEVGELSPYHKWKELGDKTIDQYSLASFFYGWT